jgi:site-specific DNA recombinase
VHVVEQLIEDHWATVTLSDATCHAMREIVLEHLQAVLPEQAAMRERAERRLADLQAESAKLLQAHYADAIGLDVLKAEQQRIALARAGAERQLADAQASGQHLERQLDRVLGLLGQAHQHYLASTSQARRYLNQGVFERIYLQDDEVVGSDLTPVFQRVLSDDLEQTLADEQRRESRRVRSNDLYGTCQPV